MPGKGKSPSPSSSSYTDCGLAMESGRLDTLDCSGIDLVLDLMECDVADPEFFLLPTLGTGTVNGGMIDCNRQSVSAQISKNRLNHSPKSSD